MSVPLEGAAVRVRPSSRWGWIGGFMLVGGSVISATGGGLLINRGSIAGQTDNSFVVPGAVLAAAAVPMIVGGIILMVKNRGGVESTRSLGVGLAGQSASR